ncbi:MAG: diacylglycerol kinase family protein, partial [Clostridia bacterium]|nr:diacylglycerol kinase family protein [Clostridia bacterium]
MEKYIDKYSLDRNDIEFVDITRLSSYQSVIDSLGKDDKFILSGGDGTLSRFINRIDLYNLDKNIYFLPSGSGNDFIKYYGGKGHFS